MLPRTIHDRTGRECGLQGIGSGQPLGKLQSPAPMKGRRKGTEELRHAAGHDLIRIQHIATKQKSGIADVERMQPHTIGVVGVELESGGFGGGIERPQILGSP